MTDRAVIVGPGRMGLALGGALVKAGIVEHVVFQGRSMEPPPHPLFERRDPADEGSAAAEYRVGPLPAPPGTTLLLLAVPDRAVAEVAWDMAQMGPAPPGCVAFHLSGVLSTDALAPLHGAGYATGSLHPLQSVADPWQACDRLFGAAYAVSGDPAAKRVGLRIVDALGGIPLVIPPTLRPLYHAAAVVASNYVVAVVGLAVRLLEGAGVPADEAPRALLPLVRGTIENLGDLGVAGALTGPISRGDADTVRLHLARLSDEERPLYSALGRESLRIARAAGLDEDRARAIDALLSAD